MKYIDGIKSSWKWNLAKEHLFRKIESYSNISSDYSSLLLKKMSCWQWKEDRRKTRSAMLCDTESSEEGCSQLELSWLEAHLGCREPFLHRARARKIFFPSSPLEFLHAHYLRNVFKMVVKYIFWKVKNLVDFHSSSNNSHHYWLGCFLIFVSLNRLLLNRLMETWRQQNAP